MRRSRFMLLLLTGLGAAAAWAEAPQLRVRVHPNARVPALEEVLLGRVAELRGPSAEQAATLSLGTAPAPGRRRVVSRAAISRILAEAGFDSGTALVEGATQLRLLGLGQHLDTERARRVLQRALRAGLPEGEVEVLEVQPPGGLQLPLGEYEISPGPLPRHPHSGRQRLVVEVVFADGTRKRIGVQAQVKVRGPVVVAARDVPRGEPLRAIDLRLETREYQRGMSVLKDPSQLVGKVARSPLRQNQPVRANLVQDAQAVHSGQTVLAVFRHGGVLLEMETRSRGSGAVGCIVPVASQDGRKTIRARVIAPGKVALLGSEEEEH